MRIRELDIENFGVFRDRRLLFDTGLQVIYGPNEAGKTTLLQLIRQLLFGFPHRNAYAFEDRSGPLSAKATVEMQDGQNLWFRRRKGRPDKVVGELERNRESVELDDRLLTAMLGNATAELYDNVFGFSLDELAQGTASLREANLTDALYGSGVGNIANVQHVRGELEADAKRLFNSRSKKSEIMQLLAKLEVDEQAWRTAQISPPQHREMLAEQVNADQAADRIKKQLVEHRALAARRALILEALPTFNEWRGLSEKLAELPEAEGESNAELTRRYQRLQKDRTDLGKASTEFGGKVQSLEMQLAKLPADGIFTTHSECIQSLHQQVGRLRHDREQVPQRKQEAESLREGVLRDLQSINPEWTSDSISQLQAGADQRDAIQRLGEQWSVLDRKRTKLRTELKSLRKLEQRWREALAAPSAEASLLEGADQLHEDLAKYRTNVARLKDAERDCARLDAARQQAAKTLAQTKGWSDEPLSQLPDSECVESFRDRFAAAEEASRECERHVTHEREQKQQLEEQLKALRLEATATEDDLAEARAARDASLATLQELMECEGQDEQAELREQLGPDPLESIQTDVRRVDAITDQLLAAAESVARRAELQQRLGKAAEQLGRRESELSRVKKELESIQAEWRAAWAEAKVDPLSASAMAGWLKEYDRWSEASEQRLRVAANADQLRNFITAYESRWGQLAENAALDVGKATGEQIVELGVAWRQTTRAQRQEHAVAEKELAAAEAQLKAIREQLDALDVESEKWAADWAKLLGQLGFPPHWDPALVQRVFQTLADGVSRLRQADALSKDSSAREAELAKAELEVEQLVAAMEISLPKMPVDATIASLYQSLDDERNGQRMKRELSIQLEDVRRRQKRSQEDLARVDEELAELQKSLNVDTPEELATKLETLNRRNALQSQVRDLQGRLSATAAQMALTDLAALVAEFETVERESLVADVEQDRIRTKELESELEQSQRRAGAAAAALERLTESTVATESARELAAGRARLGQLADRWAPLAMANQLLAMSMEQFERVNQPSLLQETSRLYEQLTGGRYPKVIRKLDEKQSLAVEDRFGNWKTSSELSTGAREQLYLAIRLAYVAEYCRRAEPLPIVMDDVLVNFDDDRAAHALETLQVCAADQQVLFLTCHQRVVDLAAKLSIPTITMAVREQTESPRKPQRKPRKPKRKQTVNHPRPSDPESGPTQKDLF